MNRKMGVSLLLLVLFLWLGGTRLRTDDGPERERGAAGGGDERKYSLLLVSAPDQQPVPHAEISLLGPGGRTWAGSSDRQGRFEFAGIIAEDFPYRLRVQHSEFRPVHWSLRGFWILQRDRHAVLMLPAGSPAATVIRYRCRPGADLLFRWRWYFDFDGFKPAEQKGSLRAESAQSEFGLELPGVPAGASVEIFATDLVSGRGDRVVLVGGQQKAGAIRVLRGQSLRGYVIDTEGRGMEGVGVRLLARRGAERVAAFSDVTDLVGSFEVGVPGWWADEVEEGGLLGTCDLEWQGEIYPDRALIGEGGRLRTIVLDVPGARAEPSK